VFDPPVPMAAYRDGFGNWCTRIVAPKGRTRITADVVVKDTGAPATATKRALAVAAPAANVCVIWRGDNALFIADNLTVIGR
jgi:hypothetical protein